jgi:photosystem II stability/assembly factor-like uncharacterized protein
MPFPKSLRSLVLLLVLFTLPIMAGDNRWTIKGPFGGSVSKLAFDPVNPSIAYAASPNGMFRSTDGGQHWVAAAEVLGTPFVDIAVANSDPQQVFASSTYGLFKSTDRGLTWFHIPGSFGSNAVAVSRTNADIVYSNTTGGPYRSSDGGVTFGNYGTGLPSPVSAVSALAVDPQSPDTVYASYLTSAGVYKSVDGGAHWTAANSGLTATVYYSLIIDPSNNSTLYVGGGPGIFRSTDGGASWAPLTNGLPPSPYCYSLSISPGSPSTVLAGLNPGLFKSTDGGSSWTGPMGFNGSTVMPVAIDPVNPANLLVTANYVTSRSSDGGANFTASSSGLTAFFTQAIAVDPRNESIVYTSGTQGVFKSTDRGETWALLTSTPTAGVAVDSQNSQTVYIIPNGVVRRSLDGGTTSQDYTTGLPSGSAQFIAVDPHVQGTIYTIMANVVYKRAGSDPWVTSSTGLPTGFLSFLAIDPNNSSTVYAGGPVGLFKSTDGGTSWNAASGGLTGVNPAGLTIDPFDSRHLLTWSNSSGYESTDGGANWASFAVAPNRQAILLAFDPTGPGRIYNSSSDAVDRSVDGGKTWYPMQTGLGRVHGTIFVIAPSGNTIYAGGNSASGSSGAGVWVFHFARRRAVAH